MKKPTSNNVALVVPIICILVSCFVQAQPDTGLSAVVNGNNAFAFDLYAKLKTANGNIFFSPYSISTALAMTYAGAKGNTEKQMAQVLHFGKNDKTFHTTFGELQNRINEVQKFGHVRLSVANSLWMQKDYKFLPGFLDLTGTNYEAGFNHVDYKNQTEKTRVEINTWVENKTQEKIKDLIKPGILNDSTRMVLANAIYFKGSWANKFVNQFTKEATFWISLKDSVNAKMMRLSQHELGYFETDAVQCISLPYTMNTISMVIILPKTRNGFKTMEGNISAEAVGSWISKMDNSRVEVYLPKFKTTKDFVLNKELSSMGLARCLRERCR